VWALCEGYTDLKPRPRDTAATGAAPACHGMDSLNATPRAKNEGGTAKEWVYGHWSRAHKLMAHLGFKV
jgi:hypothetical protein